MAVRVVDGSERVISYPNKLFLFLHCFWIKSFIYLSLTQIKIESIAYYKGLHAGSVQIDVEIIFAAIQILWQKG